jgi:hypothetical protein
MNDDERDTHRAATPDSSAEEGARRAALWRASRGVLGVVLIASGVVGCVLPIVPGIPLLIAGVALLGPKHWLVRPVTERLERWRKR